jgi:hypothetical protein
MNRLLIHLDQWRPHAVVVDGLSRREAAKRFGVHCNTITKMLSFSVLRISLSNDGRACDSPWSRMRD